MSRPNVCMSHVQHTYIHSKADYILIMYCIHTSLSHHHLHHHIIIQNSVLMFAEYYYYKS